MKTSMTPRIVKKIAELVKSYHSDAYIQAVIWGMRNNDTSMDEIDMVILIFRLFYTEEE